MGGKVGSVGRSVSCGEKDGLEWNAMGAEAIDTRWFYGYWGAHCWIFFSYRKEVSMVKEV